MQGPQLCEVGQHTVQLVHVGDHPGIVLGNILLDKVFQIYWNKNNNLSILSTFEFVLALNEATGTKLVVFCFILDNAPYLHVINDLF